MEKMRNQLIVKLVELNLLVDLFNINNTNVHSKKLEVMGLLKDINILNGTATPEVIDDINAIENFNREECKTFVDNNLKILFGEKE